MIGMVEYINELDFIWVTAAGMNTDFQAFHPISMNLNNILEEFGNNRILLDGREMKFIDSNFLSVLAAKFQRSLNNQQALRISLLYSEEGEYLKYFELNLRNHGHDIRVFKDEIAAIQWLIGSSSSRGPLTPALLGSHQK
ncbi:MAG: hypothetical protein JXA25_19310 [Anaerolineales bacterium]|nr:hypothetical protein [Anaerolineales bacterium]